MSKFISFPLKNSKGPVYINPECVESFAPHPDYRYGDYKCKLVMKSGEVHLLDVWPNEVEKVINDQPPF